MGNRPRRHVDLFTSWQHRGVFPELTAAVTATLEAAGYNVSVVISAETVTDPAPGQRTQLPLRRTSLFFEKMIIDFTLIFISRTDNLDLALGWAGSR
jgi:hypothetical protein